MPVPHETVELVKRRRQVASWPKAQPALAVALAVSLAFFESDALALGFGEPQVSSALGQPLRMRIPLRVERDVDLSSQCVRLISGDAGDPMPSLTQARLTLEENGDERALRLESMLPVNEPILRVTVEAGCLQRVRREFVLLLDPPETATPNIVAGPVPALPASALPTMAGAAPAAPSPATEVGLGIAQINSRVGQPLAMQIPVTGAGAGTLSPDCVRLSSTPAGEGAPVLSQASVSLVRNGTQSSIQVSTPGPVNEPALRVILDVGCTNPLRREYGVLLDANPNLPALAETAPPPPPPAPAPAPAAAAAPAAGPAAPAAEAPAITPTPPVAAPLPAPTVAQAAPPSPAPAPAPAAPPKRHHPHRPPAAAHPAAPAAAAPAMPAKVPAAPANAPLASNAPSGPGPESKRAPAPEKAPSPEGDHLVLAAPDDAAATALRLSEMDKRVQDLSNEITQLRTELASERQRRSEAEAQKQRGDLGWIVAALSLVGLVTGGLLIWHRNRTAGSWHGGSWSDIEPPPPLTKTGATTVLKADKLASAPPVPPAPAPAPTAAPATLRISPKKAAPPPPPPRTIIPPATTRPPRETTTGFSEVDVETAPGTMEITELQQNEPSLEKLRTLFNDVNEGNTTSPEDEVISGLGRLTVPLDLPVVPEGPVTRLPEESPNTEHGTTAFTFDESPLTQTPTLVALDLDLTTRLTPGIEDAQGKASGESPPNEKSPGKGPVAPGAKPGGESSS